MNKTIVVHLFVVMLLAWGCSAYAGETPSSHVIHYQEDASRDFTYINFNHNPLPYTHQGEVGGEHISFVKVLGFAGDKFTVAVTAIGGDVYDIINGDGVEITAIKSTVMESTAAESASKTSLYEVTVIEREALFAVELSAHPYAEYRLVITKL